MEEIVPKNQDNPIFIVNLILCMHEFKHIENNALYTNEKSLFFLIHEQVDDVIKNAWQLHNWSSIANGNEQVYDSLIRYKKLSHINI